MLKGGVDDGSGLLGGGREAVFQELEWGLE